MTIVCVFALPRLAFTQVHANRFPQKRKRAQGMPGTRGTVDWWQARRRSQSGTWDQQAIAVQWFFNGLTRALAAAESLCHRRRGING